MAEPVIGIFGINFGPLADPAVMIEIAQAAEAAGYESVWTGEHIVLPDPQAPPSPSPPETDFVDTAVALSHIAAVTDTIKLGSGIVILPQREPAVLAKSLASLDHVSGGRLLFGFGVGYLEPEMTACSTPMAARGKRADEYLAAMRVLWSADAASFDGEFVRFDSVSANPKPVQRDLHVVVGGHSMAAARRAVASAHGWYGFRRDPATATDDLAMLRRAADEVERPAHLGELQVSITPARSIDPAMFDAYVELGVSRLILSPGRAQTREELHAFVANNAPSIWAQVG